MNQVFMMHVFKAFDDVPSDVKCLLKTEKTTLTLRNFSVEISFITIFHNHENPALI
jgi:hypothetical protein